MRKLHFKFRDRCPGASERYAKGLLSAGAMGHIYAGPLREGWLWADQAYDPASGMPPRRRLHSKFQRKYPAHAERWQEGSYDEGRMQKMFPCTHGEGWLWADQSPARRDMRPEPAPEPVCEKHELPHGFELRTEAVRVEGKWMLEQVLDWEALADDSFDRDDVDYVWSERKPWDGADAVKDRIRKTVDHFRQALGDSDV